VFQIMKQEREPMKTTPEQNKKLVLEAFDTLFNKRDYGGAEKFWSPEYIQHSAHIEPGRDGLFNLIRALPDTLRYENALVLADVDLVMLHGRFSGHGRPRSWIAADIVRMEGGRLVEHWDVLQDEATKEESKSGLPMFGSSFSSAVNQSDVEPLTIAQARAIVAPLYEALNEPGKKTSPVCWAKLATQTIDHTGQMKSGLRATNWPEFLK